MADPLSYLSTRFFFNRQTVAMLTSDFTEEDWTRRLVGGNNDAHWILGHLAYSRRYLLDLLGRGVPPEPWMESFGRGATSGDNAGYPSPQALFDDFHARGKDLTETFATLTPEEAARPYGGQLPDGSETVLDAAGFFSFHETFHVGQLSALRLAAGKGGIA